MGLDRATLAARVQSFLAARPKATAFKHRIWAQCQTDKVARTFMGARRKLFGPPEVRAKDGLNHMIQGSVSNLVAYSIIHIVEAFPLSSLVMNKHDGAIMAFPACYETSAVLDKCRQMVEREWEFGEGVPAMGFPAKWEVTHG